MNSETPSNGGSAPPRPRVLKGIGGSPGVAVAPAVLVRSRLLDVPKRTIAAEIMEDEWRRFERARDDTRHQLMRLRERLGTRAVNGEAAILDAHLMVLDDELFAARVRRGIEERRHNAEWAVHEATGEFIRSLGQAGDAYLAERADDLIDVGRRLVRNLMGVAEELPAHWDKPCIVVAENLTPSETIALPRDRVLGFALDRGSFTSHAALIARALEIPAVFGLGDLSSQVHSGDQLAIDGRQGVVIVNPTPQDLKRLNGVAAARHDVLRALESLRDEPAVTPDGRRLALLANIEKIDELDAVATYGAEGVGLFRTEYLWLAGGRAVGETEQTEAYRAAARGLNGKPLTIRVFDLGGDKFMGHIGIDRESNPFLGLRSIRYLLRYPDIFKAQLRAVLRASAEGDVRLLYPMISDVAELRLANEILTACKREVAAEGLAGDLRIKVGVMIEIPSAALTADLLAQHSDFFSIGTNDLTQYTMAADRINESVVHLYQPTHPSVLRLIALTVEAARRRGIPVAVCGEMAADPLFALIFLGMGVDELSMAPSSIPVVKDAIRRTPLTRARELAAAVAGARSSGAVVRLCRELL
ncbi:MAG: phosphoenolpyruvate--protein phosphotransferase, partial [Kiritimatiellae bacterium]|nr:phosphoenolpyruvate--protein phosphotransferase [Kiritimatiellia bacterium]